MFNDTSLDLILTQLNVTHITDTSLLGNVLIFPSPPQKGKASDVFWKSENKFWKELIRLLSLTN
jgi:hypothetical protein